MLMFLVDSTLSALLCIHSFRYPTLDQIVNLERPPSSALPNGACALSFANFPMVAF